MQDASFRIRRCSTSLPRTLNLDVCPPDGPVLGYLVPFCSENLLDVVVAAKNGLYSDYHLRLRVRMSAAFAEPEDLTNVALRTLQWTLTK